MNERLVAALMYCKLGWFVIPLDPFKKYLSQPLAEQLSWVEHSPVCTEEEIERWFSVEPEINIGIDLARSGLSVVDVDRLDLWMEFSDGHSCAIARVRTARGAHYYFKASPEDMCGTIWNDRGNCLGDFLAPQMVPWRDGHAYTVAPPSRFENGQGAYSWSRWGLPDAPPDPETLTPVPDWIRAAVRTPSEPWSMFGADPDDDYDDAETEIIDEFEWVSDDPEHEAFIDEWFASHFPPGSDGPYDGWEADADCAYDEHMAEMARGPFEGEMPEPDA